MATLHRHPMAGQPDKYAQEHAHTSTTYWEEAQTLLKLQSYDAAPLVWSESDFIQYKSSAALDWTKSRQTTRAPSFAEKSVAKLWEKTDEWIFTGPVSEHLLPLFHTRQTHLQSSCLTSVLTDIVKSNYNKKTTWKYQSFGWCPTRPVKRKGHGEVKS